MLITILQILLVIGMVVIAVCFSAIAYCVVCYDPYAEKPEKETHYFAIRSSKKEDIV